MGGDQGGDALGADDVEEFLEDHAGGGDVEVACGLVRQQEFGGVGSGETAGIWKSAAGLRKKRAVIVPACLWVDQFFLGTVGFGAAGLPRRQAAPRNDGFWA